MNDAPCIDCRTLEAITEARLRITKLEREVERLRDAIRANCTVDINGQSYLMEWAYGLIP